MGLGINTYQIAYPSKIVYAAESEQPVVVQIEVVIDWTKERINREIEEQAEKYAVNASEMKRVIACESNGSTTIQSRHIRPDGSREKSFGLVQIYLPAHPNVTYEQAIDPKFAINFMAKNFAHGREEMWSCW